VGPFTTNAASPNDSWAAAALSDSGTCYWIKDVATSPGAGTFYGSGAICTATAAQGANLAKFP
jgi:hypothetical protein